MRPFILNFGKFRGISLEEIALGKTAKGGKSEGYHYFHQLGTGDPKYFGYFQRSPVAMAKWNQVHHKLNNFVADYPCAVCKQDPLIRPPTIMTVVGSGRYGYSIGPGYICCDDPGCQRVLKSYHHGVFGIPLGFDAILNFGWSSGGTKSDEKHFAQELRRIAGWQGRLTAESAAEFIDKLKVR